jgi:hypothetical protein
MASTIKLKNGSGAPTTGDLVQGEPALDLTNKRLYTENASGVVIEVGTNPTSVTTGNITANGTINLTGATVSNAGSITTADINGGTIDGTVIGGTTPAAVTTSSLVATTADINAGTIDGTVIGGSSAAAGSFTTLTASGEITANGGIALGDGDVATFGDSDDLSIFHAGGTTYLTNTTGSLVLRTDSFRVLNTANSEQILHGDANGAVTAYYDNSVKLATTATGIDVTGTVTADGLVTQATANSYTAGAAQIKSLAGDISYITNVGGAFLISNSSTTDQFTLSSAGNVGIGTSSVSAPLHVNATSTGNLLVRDAALAVGGYTGTALSSVNSAVSATTPLTLEGSEFNYVIGNANKVKIDSAGNVGIGTSIPSTLLHIKSTGSATATIEAGGGGDAVLDIKAAEVSGGESIIRFSDSVSGVGFITYAQNDGGSDYMRFGTASTERMRIDASGNLLIGVTSISDATSRTYGNAFSGTGANANWTSWGSGSQTHALFRNGTGVVGSIVTNSSSTTYNTSSDQRLKDNIVDAPSSSDDIDAIQVRSFDWKADGSHQKYGMIAQELMTVAPEAVSGDPESDEMMGVDYSKLVPMLVKEIQSLRARVAQLEGAN